MADGAEDADGVEEFFAGSPRGRALYTAIADAVAATGPAQVRVTQSQIAFRRRRGFAYVWRPGQYVSSDVPVVLSIALDHSIDSDRFKEVAHPAARTWMHHLEVTDVDQLDDEVRRWLEDAYRYGG